MKTLLINAARCSSAVLLSAAVLLGTVSCGPKSTTHRNPEGLVSVNYADLKQGEDILISEWVGEPEFIALESRPEALVTGGQFTISDHYIGVYRKNSETPFKLFDRATGKYLRDIGGIGRGPGEYNSISSAQLDEAGGKVWISTIDRHNIYGYDISTGRLVADIKLPYKADNNTNNGFNFLVDSLSSTITVVPLPFKDKCPAAAWCQDMEGNILWEIPKTYTMEENVLLTMRTGRNTPGTMDLCFESNNTAQDTLYVLENREIKPILTVQFEDITEPGHLDLSDGTLFRSPILLPDYAVLRISRSAGVTSRGTEFFVKYESLPNVVMDRRTEEVSLRNIVDDIMTWNDNNFRFSDGYLANSYDALTFQEAGAKALTDGTLSEAVRTRISSILDGLTENDNIILMIAPLK